MPRVLTAARADGREVTWEEEAVDPAGGAGGDLAPAALRCRVPSDRGVAGGRRRESTRRCASCAAREELILDLRRNPGGNLVLAATTRDRFLRTATTLGSIRYSVGGGELSPAVPLAAEPPEPRRGGRAVSIALVDELTFSSSEDFLLGLQGLEHVTVVGRPSGGGSGRPRSVRLLPGWTLTVSTALTYDRSGRCIEGAGIPADVLVPLRPGGDRDDALEAAERLV